MYKTREFVLLLACLSGCSPATLDDLRCQGEAETRKLAAELREIETREDLQKKIPRLKKRFSRIADLLLEVRKFPNPPQAEPTMASEELFVELARLYEVPGTREIVESAQSEAIHHLAR